MNVAAHDNISMQEIWTWQNIQIYTSYQLIYNHYLSFAITETYAMNTLLS